MHPTKGRGVRLRRYQGAVAKEGYAPSIAPSPFKRHGGLKILLLIKVKSFRQTSENFAESKKSIIFAVSIKKEVKNEYLEFLL